VLDGYGDRSVRLCTRSLPRMEVRGGLAHEEATGTKVFIDDMVSLQLGAWRSALVISIEGRADWSPATNMRAE
jgi:hypothetical protein